MVTRTYQETVLQSYAIAAVIFGFLAVALGAFGAHALKGVLAGYGQGIYQTAVLYQMFHTLALGFAAIPPVPLNPRWQRWSCRFLACGILLFSGSLYLLAVTEVRWLGAITPLGGVSFLIGWFCLGLAIWRRHERLGL